MDRRHADLLIDGEWCAAAAGEVVTISDPATGEPVGSAALGGEEDARAALAAARDAGPSWAATPAHERAAILSAGAALARARIDYYADLAPQVGGEWRPTRQPGIRSLVLRQPVGVVVAIVPWNYPIDLLSWKIGPALAAGCTVVAKPPTETPLAAALFAACFGDAGLPAGVLNYVVGRGASVGDELVRNPFSRLITITGSTETGRHVMRLAAEHIKRLSLELGGQSPLLVLDDADIESVVPAAVRRSYSNAGQICIAVNRIFVADALADDFTEAFADGASRLRMGHGLDDGVELGPLLNEETRQRSVAHVTDARGGGAVVVTGGEPPDGEPFRRGFFYEPTVLTEVRPEMQVGREETFGPVTAISRFTDLDDAIDQANDTPYGLAAYVFGQDLERCLHVAERLVPAASAST